MNFKTEILQYSDDTVRHVSDILLDGGIVAIPTETVYGLAANAFDADAVKKIFIAKGRPQDNPLIVHIGHIDQLSEVASSVPEAAFRLAENFWPGPLSIIVPKSERIPDVVTCGLNSVAVRMPSNPIASQIINTSGVPLAAPSANLSGRPSPTTAEHVIADLNGKIDAIIDGGKCSVGVESTVISLVGEKPRLLRPGGITLEQLKSVLGEVEVDDAVLAEIKPGQTVSSPGMKYKHYSPSARVILLSGSLDRFINFVSTKRSSAAICFDGEASKLDIPSLEIGGAEDYSEQAVRLFDALRAVDQLGAEVVYVHMPAPKGIGLAVVNRLLRAAAFTVVDLDGPVLIGVTGQTGAGKTYVTSILKQQYGYGVVDCDQLARVATSKESRILPVLSNAFGSDIIDDSGCLIRHVLAEKAFSSSESTRLLNSIVHPEVIRLLNLKINELKLEGNRAIIIDAPQLFESGIDKLCHFNVAVVASEETRLKRLLLRDKISEKDLRLRMKAQLSESDFRKMSDVILENDSDSIKTSDIENINNMVRRYRYEQE